MAFEELDIGTWDGCAGVHGPPVTQKDELLTVLDISDPKHPRLRPSSVIGGSDDVVVRKGEWSASSSANHHEVIADSSQVER